MSTRALHQVLASTSCSRRAGCPHCLAKSELARIEFAALVVKAGPGASEREREQLQALLLFIADDWLRLRQIGVPSDVDAKEAA